MNPFHPLRGRPRGAFRIDDLAKRLDRRLVCEEEYGETGRLGSAIERIEEVYGTIGAEGRWLPVDVRPVE